MRVILAVFCLIPFLANAETSALYPSSKENTGRTVLIVVPDKHSELAKKLATLLATQFNLASEIENSGEYNPGIDTLHYDALIYLGESLKDPPDKSLLNDIEKTKKPVIWINDYAWLLSDAFKQGKSLTVAKKHSTKFIALAFNQVSELPSTEVTIVTAPEDKVLFWLYDAQRIETQPGAVISGNFAYMPYMPSMDPGAPDYNAVVSFLRKTLVFNAKPRPVLSYKERVKIAREDKFRTGIHLPAYVSSTGNIGPGYDSHVLHRHLIRIKQAGAEWVTFGQIYYQDGIKGTNIYPDPKLTPSFDALSNIIQDAHKIGLLVRLSPIVNLAKGTFSEGDWRGFIRPEDLKSWWKSYRELILKIAMFAKDNEVESLNVGAELSAMLRDKKQWQTLIEDIKKKANFKGLIGYQINYDTLQDIAWADSLDYLSIAAYWPLSEDRDPSQETLRNSWKNIKSELLDWKKENPDISMEFGEIGYASQPYASVLPFSWKPFKGKSQDLNEQLNCYLSLEEFLAENKFIEGVHFFASTEEDYMPDNLGYTPFGKPAGEVMKHILTSR